MLAEDDGAVMSSGFCSEIYQLTADDLRSILESESDTGQAA
jgi:hypothetical protein